MGNLISQNSGGRSAGSTQLVQRFFLERLRRMVAIRREHAPLLEAGDSSLRLLDKAVYSTFCDCLDLGTSDEARTILRQDGHPPASSPGGLLPDRGAS